LAKSIHTASAEQLLQQSSNRFKRSVDVERLRFALNRIRSEYGTLSSSRRLRTLIYEAYSDKPNFVSIHYLQEFNNEKKIVLKTSLVETAAYRQDAFYLEIVSCKRSHATQTDPFLSNAGNTVNRSGSPETTPSVRIVVAFIKTQRVGERKTT